MRQPNEGQELITKDLTLLMQCTQAEDVLGENMDKPSDLVHYYIFNYLWYSKRDINIAEDDIANYHRSLTL